MFLRCSGQARSVVNVSRVPPWRRWVGVRESVPEISFGRGVELAELISYPEAAIEQVSLSSGVLPAGRYGIEAIASSTGNSVTMVTDTVNMMICIVPQFRKFLLPASQFQLQAKEELDNYCAHLQELLPLMPVQDKVKLLCSFGQLREYSVVNRIPDRYNTRRLAYVNLTFYKVLLGSIAWGSLFSEYLSRSRSLTPLMEVVRALNRMGLDEGHLRAVLPSLLDDLVDASNSRPLGPAQLTELVMIASKNRLVHEGLFGVAVSELSLNFNGFKEDLLGDLIRSFTTVKYFSKDLHAVLSRELPPRTHEYFWWNLIDLADYYAGVVPKPFCHADKDTVARLANEVWKWVPDLRCGYAAKALRILAELGVGDSRTHRSLIRAIPKGLSKLHPQHAAESIVAASKVGYDPRGLVGKKKFGSLFYRRLATKLVNPHNPNERQKQSPLASLKSGVVVELIAALAKVNRPQSELFDMILLDIATNKPKYTRDDLTEIRKILIEKLAFHRGDDLITKTINSMDDGNAGPNEIHS